MKQYKIFIEGDIFNKGIGGLPDEGKITTKIAPINSEDANSEIEKGELVLDPKTGALHKALGKPHSKGGTPVNLKDNSFIFSNFKDLAIDKKQKKLFEFKMGGSKAKNNTPAKVLEREVDLEHHNKMVDILQNEKKFDAPTLNAAKLMMLRNLEKAGQVAFIQESKKGDNIPNFAQDTAPIYSKDTDQKISQAPQYLQMGGRINDNFNKKVNDILDYAQASRKNINVYSNRVIHPLFKDPEEERKYEQGLLNDFNTANTLGNKTFNQLSKNINPIFKTFPSNLQKLFPQLTENADITKLYQMGGTQLDNELQNMKLNRPLFTNPVSATNKFQAGGFKDLRNNNTNTTNSNYYTYGPNGEVLKEFDASGNLVKDFGVELPEQSTKTTSDKPTWGIWKGDKSSNFQTKFGKSNAFTSTKTLDEYANQLNYHGKKDNKSFMEWMYNNKEHPEWKDILNKTHSKEGYGMPTAGQVIDPEHFGIRWTDALDEIVQPKIIQTTPITPYTSPERTTGVGEQKIVERQKPGEVPGNAKGIVDRTNYKSKLSLWQKIDSSIPFYRAMTVKTQYPIRQHQESVIPQFENINAQPQLNQTNQGYFNAANTLRTLNPTQASAYIGQLAGNRIDTNNQILGNIQNQNSQTQNRQKEMAATSLNRDAEQNRAFDKQFYDSTQTAIKNSDELKQAYEQQGVKGINDMMSKKLAFDSWLNTQQQYRGKATYIDKDGIQHYQGAAPFIPKAGFWGNSVQNNPLNIDWSTYQSNQNSNNDAYGQMMARYKLAKEEDPGLDFEKFQKTYADLTKSGALNNYGIYQQQMQQQIPPQKMGGKFKMRKRNKLY